MAFLDFFRAQVPNILIRLKSNRLELNKIQSDIERLLIMEQNCASKVLTERQYEFCVKTAIDTFGVALWIKDISGGFIFANKRCCASLLRCTEEEASSLTSADFGKNSIPGTCMESDRLVIESQKTMRFIEHSVYPDGEDIFLDVIKSPFIENGEIVGIVGSGAIITNSIPASIRNQSIESKSIEIPVNSSVGTQKLIKLIERRKPGARNKEDDERYRQKREEIDGRYREKIEKENLWLSE